MSESALFKALSDHNRLRLLYLLMQEPKLCVCELSDALELPQYQVSRCLGHLKKAGIIESERQGTWIYYSMQSESQRLDAFLQSLRIYLENPEDEEEACYKADVARMRKRLRLRSGGCCVVGFSAAT
jgi:ArsR family transcriptional regulator